MNGLSYILGLPDELLARCFSFLDTRVVVLILPLVCTRFRAVCRKSADAAKAGKGKGPRKGIAAAPAARRELWQLPKAKASKPLRHKPLHQPATSRHAGVVCLPRSFAPHAGGNPADPRRSVLTGGRC